MTPNTINPLSIEDENEQPTIVAPAALLPEHLIFLDELRDSGITNMFGARPYLMEMYPDLSSSEASDVLSFWMRTFGTRHPR